MRISARLALLISIVLTGSLLTFASGASAADPHFAGAISVSADPLPFASQPVVLTGAGASPGSRIEVSFDDDAPVPCVEGTVLVDGNGEWTCTTVVLDPGSHRASAVAFDPNDSSVHSTQSTLSFNVGASAFTTAASSPVAFGADVTVTGAYDKGLPDLTVSTKLTKAGSPIATAACSLDVPSNGLYKCTLDPGNNPSPGSDYAVTTTQTAGSNDNEQVKTSAVTVNGSVLSINPIAPAAPNSTIAVTGSYDKSLPSASVSAALTDGGDPASAATCTTDPAGTYTCTLPPGDYPVSVVDFDVTVTQSPGGRTVTQPLTISGSGKAGTCANPTLATSSTYAVDKYSDRSLVSVATYNIVGQSTGGFSNWPGRRNYIVDHIVRCMPDVIGTNEASEAYLKKTKTSGDYYFPIRSQYEDLTDQVNTKLKPYFDQYRPTDLRRKLCRPQSDTPNYWSQWDGSDWPTSGHPASWRKCVIVDEDDSPSDNRILFNAAKFKLVKRGFKNLGDNATATNRTVAWAILEKRDAAKKQFLVASTHLESSKKGESAKTSDARRVRQAKVLIGEVQARNGGLPTFIIGDLNTSRYSKYTTATDVISKAGFVDLMGGTDSSCTVKKTTAGVPYAAANRIRTWYNTSNNPALNNKCAYVTKKVKKKIKKKWKTVKVTVVRPANERYKGNGVAIDYIFGSPTVRAVTWETVVNPDKPTGIKYASGYKGRPSDHNMLMSYIYY